MYDVQNHMALAFTSAFTFSMPNFMPSFPEFFCHKTHQSLEPSIRQYKVALPWLILVGLSGALTSVLQCVP